MLLANVPDRQLCVLYRSGAFHAAFKREDVFYVLLSEAPPPEGTGGESSTAAAAAAAAAVWEEIGPDGAAGALVSSTFQAITGPGGAPLQRTGAAATRARNGPAPPPPQPRAAVTSMPLPPPLGGITRVGALSPFAAAAAAGGAGGGGAAPSVAEGEQPEPNEAEERDRLLALRLQASYEEAERAARMAVRQAASRLQQQQERGSGGLESTEVREFVVKVEKHVREDCALQ